VEDPEEAAEPCPGLPIGRGDQARFTAARHEEPGLAVLLLGDERDAPAGHGGRSERVVASPARRALLFAREDSQGAPARGADAPTRPAAGEGRLEGHAAAVHRRARQVVERTREEIDEARHLPDAIAAPGDQDGAPTADGEEPLADAPLLDGGTEDDPLPPGGR